jgi:hypothetical protein
VVSGVIQQGIDLLDESIELAEEETEVSISPRDGHVSLGSPLPPTSLEAIDHRSNEDPIFKDFRKNLGMWFSRILQKNIKLGMSHSVRFLQSHNAQI